jgi:alpha-galactosidase
MLGTHIGPTHAHSTGRTHELSFRAITALFGHAGLEWDLTETTAQERAALKAWTDYYKANRALLHSGRVVRVDSVEVAAQPTTAWTHGVVAQDGSRAIFAYVALAMSQFALPPTLRLAGLDTDALYRVKLVTPAGGYQSTQKFDPEWVNGVTVDGGFLMSAGLRAPILKPENAFLLEVERA